jgi:hypothetical protein
MPTSVAVTQEVRNVLSFVEGVCAARRYDVDISLSHTLDNSLFSVAGTSRSGEGKLTALVFAGAPQTSGVRLPVVDVMSRPLPGLSQRFSKSVVSGVIGSDLAKWVAGMYVGPDTRELIVVGEVVTAQARSFFGAWCPRYTQFSYEDCVLAQTHMRAPLSVRVSRPKPCANMLSYNMDDPIVRIYGCRPGEVVTVEEWDADFGVVTSSYVVSDAG